MSKKEMEKGFREGVDGQADLFVLRRKRKRKGAPEIEKKETKQKMKEKIEESKNVYPSF